MTAERVQKSLGPRPDYTLDTITQITTGWLHLMQIRGLLLDIDNTITRWEEDQVPESELAWLHAMRDDSLQIRFISNGLDRKVRRVEAQTGLTHIAGRPLKPLPTGFRRGLEEMELEPHEVLMVGDSAVTDIAIANRIGIWTVLVEPMSSVHFPGSKFWQVIERAFSLRFPATPEGEMRRQPPSRR
ncbi:YqeG family HAD IIIA-type phosphatase [bacterium]|nr:YqeG family HAD IIIA-type phosphatase [bacterium]